MNKKIWRKIYWGVVILLILFAAVGIVNNIRDPDAAYSRLIDQYTYEYTEGVKGGATPRETLDLFVAAIEAGDIDEALLYIDPEQRQYYEADMREGLKNGNLQLVIDDLKRVDNGLESGNTRYEFYSTDPQTGSRFTYDLVYNDLANIWMFESI